MAAQSHITFLRAVTPVDGRTDACVQERYMYMRSQRDMLSTKPSVLNVIGKRFPFGDVGMKPDTCVCRTRAFT